MNTYSSYDMNECPYNKNVFSVIKTCVLNTVERVFNTIGKHVFSMIETHNIPNTVA